MNGFEGEIPKDRVYGFLAVTVDLLCIRKCFCNQRWDRLIMGGMRDDVAKQTAEKR